MMRFASIIAIAAFAQGALAEKAQGISILPPGIATGLAAKARSLQPVTLAMHPPEEDAHAVNTAIDGFLKVEQLRSKSAEAAEVAQKQRLLNAEIAKIHSIVGGASFLRGPMGDIVPSSDYTVNVH